MGLVRVRSQLLCAQTRKAFLSLCNFNRLAKQTAAQRAASQPASQPTPTAHNLRPPDGLQLASRPPRLCPCRLSGPPSLTSPFSPQGSTSLSLSLSLSLARFLHLSGQPASSATNLRPPRTLGTAPPPAHCHPGNKRTKPADQPADRWPPLSIGAPPRKLAHRKRAPLRCA